ncbi:MAG: prolipoprotein diacylglyceryl transferase [Salinarimonadaceae bacterium]|nr:MAG: prolipoprotein diacylglyceryl transferase [Salinarimonadaceae bacterium]
MPFPDIDPVAFSLGPLVVRWYALAYIAGLLGGWLVARRLVAADGLWGGVRRPSREDIDDLLVWIAFGVIIGGRLGYVIFYNPGSYLARPLEILYIWQGGMSFHGGLVGAIAASFLFGRSRAVSGFTVLDIVAVVAPIGLLFGRIANFINGELWGRPAPDFPFAVIFPFAGPEPRYPSQLFEAATQGLLLFIVMLAAVAFFGLRRPGLLSGIFAIGYAIARIFCEFFREPDPQLGFLFGEGAGWLGGGVTMGMLLSLPLALAGAAAIVAARRGATLPATPGGRGAA